MIGNTPPNEQASVPEWFETLKPELTRYCYKMLGSTFDADDAVQDTFVRAWQGWDRFRQQASPRTWLYRIATNVCLDKLRSAKRRALSMDLADPADIVAEPQQRLPHDAWIWPIASPAEEPEEALLRQEALRFSFLALLQTLPPRQRAVLLLNDVYAWPSKQTAEALGMTTAAVNSALQRARAAMSSRKLRSEALRHTDAEPDDLLLAKYVNAFERYDIDALLALFHETGSLSMPPFDLWLSGRDKLASFYRLTRGHCAGSRLLPLDVNGGKPAFAQYATTGEEPSLAPWGIHVLEIRNRQLLHVHTFIDARLFARFGLPEQLPR